MDSVLPLQTRPDAHRLPNAVLGVSILIAAEVMFFAAFISAHTIARATALGGVWPPAGQPRLPFERTAVNTAALLLSGLLLWTGNRPMVKSSEVARRCIVGAILLGAAFVALQGVEWIALLREGLTMTSSAHGGFFYLIIGAHALHVVGGLVALTWAFAGILRKTLAPETFTATRLFWYFVVLLWPVLYWRVYL